MADHPTSGVRQRGAVLMLMPVGVLVVLVLGSLAVDLGLVHLRQLELDDLAAAAANDAASALAADTLYTTGTVALAPDAARAAAAATVAARDLEGVRLQAVTIDGDRVRVVLSLHVEYLLAPVMPGAPGGRTLQADSDARLIPDDR